VSHPPVVLAAVPTLFGPDGELDRNANRALYKLISGLLDGMLVAGTTGEFPALEDAERLWLAEQALAEAGPDRVIVHIGAPDARHTAKLARAAVALGARRIAAITPYYLPARPDELVTHYRSVREAAPGAEIYAYIFPERTGLTVPPPVFAQVAEAASLAGAKISGSASADLAGYVAAAPGLRIFSGNDADPWATTRAGAEGVISGRSSAYPELYAALVKDPAVQERLDRVVALGASVGRIKHALRARGLAGTGARMTVDPPDQRLAAAIEAEVAALSTVTCSLPARASTGGGGGASFCVEVRRKRGAGPLHKARQAEAERQARRERGAGLCPA
jgi:4-hydroxy-tetrahydrodipicolinate synthase